MNRKPGPLFQEFFQTFHHDAAAGCCNSGLHQIRCDIRTGLLEYTLRWNPEGGTFRGALRVHWGARYTGSRIYQREAFRLRCRIRKGHLMTASIMIRRAVPFTLKKIRKLIRSAFMRPGSTAKT